ncbi:MAG: hypothetical protein M1838_001695 [Thelocarpon superellum]|nr:MAG: hypothetical protein M1838_001695 [Thelocarpon superellum]
MEKLQSEYCPPLDEALLLAISSEFDLDDEQSLQLLRDTLDPLRDAASGESVADVHLGSEDLQELDWDLRHEDGSGYLETTSSDRTSSCLDADGDAYALSLENLDRDGKVALLQEMFPGVGEFTVAHTLKKTGDKFNAAVEQLLTQVFLEKGDEDGEVLLKKGVDGFAADNVARDGTLKSKKRRHHLRPPQTKRTEVVTSGLMDVTNQGQGSKWDLMKEEIDFLASRTQLRRSTVVSIYHQNGATIPAALQAIMKLPNAEGEDADELDPVVEVQLKELRDEFPTIPTSDMLHLIRLTRPSLTAAHELAMALTNIPRPSAAQGLEIITRLPPISLASSDTAVQPRARSHVPQSHAEATALASAYGTARQRAFAQASEAYRKGKSDHLMGAAAGYYSSLGREYDSHARQYSAAAADAMVDAQSSRAELDLHGVRVKDALRIARERVTTWWVGLGESRIGGRAGAGQAYRIVTGVGRHSEGGKAKIGPAVGRMLMREGWKVEVGEGALVVTGVAKPW